MSYLSVVLGDSPSLLWPLNETTGTTAADASGNGNTGTYTGGYTLASAAGPLAAGGSAVLLNGTTGEIQSAYNPALAAISIECWVNLNGLTQSGNPRFLADDHTDSDNKGFELFDNGGKMQVYMGGGTTSYEAFSGTTAVPATGWAHFVATFNGTTMVVYQNAVSIASTSVAGTVSAGTANFAAGYNPAYSGDYVKGLMAWAAIYPSALTAAQVLNHYNAAAAGPARVSVSITSQAVKRASLW